MEGDYIQTINRAAIFGANGFVHKGCCRIHFFTFYRIGQRELGVVDSAEVCYTVVFEHFVELVVEYGSLGNGDGVSTICRHGLSEGNQCVVVPTVIGYHIEVNRCGSYHGGVFAKHVQHNILGKTTRETFSRMLEGNDDGVKFLNGAAVSRICFSEDVACGVGRVLILYDNHLAIFAIGECTAINSRTHQGEAHLGQALNEASGNVNGNGRAVSNYETFFANEFSTSHTTPAVVAETYRSNFLNILLEGEDYLLGQSFERVRRSGSNGGEEGRINAEVNQLDSRGEVYVVVGSSGAIEGIFGVLHCEVAILGNVV